MLSLTNKYGIVESVIFSFSFLEEKIPFCICKTRFLFFIFSATQEKILQGYIVNSNITISIYIEIPALLKHYKQVNIAIVSTKKKGSTRLFLIIIITSLIFSGSTQKTKNKNKTKQNLYIHTSIHHIFILERNLALQKQYKQVNKIVSIIINTALFSLAQPKIKTLH